MEMESARGWLDFLAMHVGACYCLTGEIGEDGQAACFFPPTFCDRNFFPFRQL
jgi:hypothetical protein